MYEIWSLGHKPFETFTGSEVSIAVHAAYLLHCDDYMYTWYCNSNESNYIIQKSSSPSFFILINIS